MLERMEKGIFCFLCFFTVFIAIAIITPHAVFGDELPGPVITAPVEGTIYDPVALTTRWNNVSGASYYKVALRDLTTDTLIIDSQIVYGTSYTISSDKLTPGHSYRLSVASVSGDVSSWSEVNFSITDVSLTAPVINNPVEGANYYTGSSIVAGWNNVPGAFSYKVTLKDLTENSVKVDGYNNGTKTSYTIYSNYLINGHSYKFSVAAVAGSLNQWSEVNFTVNDPEELASPVITSPLEGVGYDLGSIAAVWDSVPEAASYKVTLKDQTENAVKIDGYNNGTKTSYTILSYYLTPAHSYTLTITAVAGSTSKSSSVNFSINDLTSPIITVPVEGTIYDPVALTAKWNSVPGASYYNVSLFDLTSETLIIDNQYTYGTSYKITSDKLTPGHNYKLSVASVNGDIVKGSEVNFSIVDVNLTAPVINNPVEGANYFTGNSIVAGWDSVSGAFSYKVTLKDLTENSVKVDGYNNGTKTSFTIYSNYLINGHSYKFSVAAVAGSLNQWSEVNFTVNDPEELASPVITSPLEGGCYDYGSITAGWESVPLATGYKVTLKDLTDNSVKIDGYNTWTGTAYTISFYYFTPGHNYTLTVCAVAGSTNKSSSINFSINDLTNPVITVPVEGASYDPTSLTATWNSVPGAFEYKVTLRDLTADTLIIDNDTTNSTKYTIPSDILTPGHNYKLSVASVNGDVNKWSEVNFSIKDVSLTAPVITKPVDGSYYYSGNSISVAWDSVPGATGYKVTLKDITENSVIIDQYNNGTRTTYTIYSNNIVNGHSYLLSIIAAAGTLTKSSEVGFKIKDPNYQYDDNSRLNSVVFETGQTAEYIYDANGNLIRRSLR